MPTKPKRQVGLWDYVLPDERALPVEAQGVFTLAPLDVDARARAQDERARLAVRGEEMVTESRTRQWALGLVLSHLVATQRVPSDAPAVYPGPEAPLERRKAWINENLDDLTVLLVGLEIYERSELGPAEKNG